MYCAARIAWDMKNDEHEVAELRARDFDAWYKMDAILPEGYGDSLHDLMYICGSQFKYNTPLELHSAYVVAPQGLTETIGVLHDETAAWLVIDENGPALMYRRGDNSLEPYIEHWKEFWLDNPAPGKWPKATLTTSALWVPYAMRKLSIKEKRAKRRRDRAGQRHIY